MTTIPRSLRVAISICGVLLAMGTAPAGAQTSEAGCRVFGLVSNDLGIVLSGAWVTVTGLEDGQFTASTTTSRNGAFSINVPTCQPVLVAVTLFGYGSASESVEFAGPGSSERRTYPLTRRPIGVDPLIVNVSGSVRLAEVGFYDRMARLDSLGRDYADFYDPRQVVGRSRAIHTVGGLAAGSRIRFVYGGGGCRPAFYIDGIELDRKHDFFGWLDHLVKPEDVEGMEIYRSIWAAIPEQYRQWRSNVCGLVLVWTKYGHPPPADP